MYMYMCADIEHGCQIKVGTCNSLDFVVDRSEELRRKVLTIVSLTLVSDKFLE